MGFNSALKGLTYEVTELTNGKNVKKSTYPNVLAYDVCNTLSNILMNFDISRSHNGADELSLLGYSAVSRAKHNEFFSVAWPQFRRVHCTGGDRGGAVG